MNADQFNKYGFVAGEVRGTRAWKVDNQGRLRGIVYRRIWRPGENVSECLRGIPPDWAAAVAKGARASVMGASVSPRGSGVGGGGGVVSSFTPPGGQTVYFNGTPVGGAPATLCPCGCGVMIASTSAAAAVMKEEMAQPCTGIEPECSCGFYGYQEGSNDYYTPDSKGSQKGPIGGVFRGYGKVVLGTRGFRAEKAEILALYVDEATLAESQIDNSLIRMRLEENYKVPMFDDYLDLLKAFPPDPPERTDDFWEAS